VRILPSTLPAFRLAVALAAVIACGALSPVARGATLSPYAGAISAFTGGGHRVALGDAGGAIRVIDESDGRQIAEIVTPRDFSGCRLSGMGGAGVAFACNEGIEAVSPADGHARAFPTSTDFGSWVTVTEVGRRWIRFRDTPYHLDKDGIVDARSGALRWIRESVMGDPYQVALDRDQVVDLGAADGVRRLCRPIRRRGYRSDGLFFRGDAGGAAWQDYPHGVWIQRCGGRPIRVSRIGGWQWVATRHTVAWLGSGSAVAVDRRTLHRRTWRFAPDAYAALALSRDRIWVSSAGRVLTGRLPGR
jgi:hypothetical protein